MYNFFKWSFLNEVFFNELNKNEPSNVFLTAIYILHKFLFSFFDIPNLHAIVQENLQEVFNNGMLFVDKFTVNEIWVSLIKEFWNCLQQCHLNFGKSFSAII